MTTQTAVLTQNHFARLVGAAGDQLKIGAQEEEAEAALRQYPELRQALADQECRELLVRSLVNRMSPERNAHSAICPFNRAWAQYVQLTHTKDKT